MDLETLKLAISILNVFVLPAIAVIGWLMQRAVSQIDKQLDELKVNIGDRIDKVEKELREIEETVGEIQIKRRDDMTRIIENYVGNDPFYRSLGEIKASIVKVFDKIEFLNSQVNRLIGQAETERDA